jgi:DNA-binding NtrC family response regulator
MPSPDDRRRPREEPDARADTLIVESRPSFKVRKLRLVVTDGPSAGQSLTTEKERVRIGKEAGNDLVLADRTVSREHAEIVLNEKGYLLVDLASTNGTFVDGRRVERAFLAPHTQIQLGESSRVAFTLVEEEVAVEADAEGFFAGMVGRSMKMRQIFGLLKKVAPMDVSVLIQGETGTGKELAARAVHDHSRRRSGPFVVLDCSAIPENLIESELFGHEKGAFTGAVSARAGAFERANGGTIFLDELGELRVDLQPKLLRVLESREVRRVGGSQTFPVDVRVVAATNRDLAKEVQGGTFREDLYFRLAVIHVPLPPLRERREDIPHIVRRALADPDVVQVHGVKSVTPEAMALLAGYPWPGNIRELVNVVSHVLTFSEGDTVDVASLPSRFQPGEGGARPGLAFNEHLAFKEAKEQLLEAFEREYLTTLLTRTQGNMSQAARESGLHRKTIERLVKKHELDAKGMKLRA